MSDPVTNVEIEDVLSSIRRLVSAGEEAKAPANDAEEQPSGPPPRFVLTPAFRVTEPDEQVESAQHHAPEVQVASPTTLVFEDDASDIDNSQSARHSLEATIAELEAAVIDQPDEWEPDGSEVTTVPTWDTVSYPPLDEVEDAIAVAETTPEDMRTAPPLPPEPVQLDVAFSAPEPAALKDDGWSAPAAETDADPLFTAGPVIAEDAVYAADTPASAVEDAVTFADAENVETLAFAHSGPVNVPDTPSDEFGDELAPDPVSQDDDLNSYMLADGQGINEEVLRQMVMDVVREELQGNLGERITRNVRKMVRREIHRALDMQNFD